MKYIFWQSGQAEESWLSDGLSNIWQDRTGQRQNRVVQDGAGWWQERLLNLGFSPSDILVDWTRVSAMPICPISRSNFVWLKFFALTKLLQVFNELLKLFPSYLSEFLSLRLSLQSLQQSSSAAFSDQPPKHWWQMANLRDRGIFSLYHIFQKLDVKMNNLFKALELHVFTWFCWLLLNCFI